MVQENKEFYIIWKFSNGVQVHIPVKKMEGVAYKVRNLDDDVEKSFFKDKLISTHYVKLMWVEDNKLMVCNCKRIFDDKPIHYVVFDNYRENMEEIKSFIKMIKMLSITAEFHRSSNF